VTQAYTMTSPQCRSVHIPRLIKFQNFLKKRCVCYLVGIKAQWVAEEYCWAMTQVALRLCCCRSGSIVSEFGS